MDESVRMNGDEEEEEFSDEEGGVRIGDIYIPPAPKPACSFDTTGPRLIITHIDNENFKSYYGKQSLGPFHKCFNSIVGPNGSGKSNVIDSMLFVFGYRANKIRSKKISVLIHSSDNHQDVQSCTVAVNFQQIIDKGETDFEVVPNTKLVIARTAFKDNSSYYMLNNKRVQFKEIAKTLRSHGIDLDHNRFLILQGEVEQIAMMKPKGLTEHETGMLEYLEDIVGTSRFKEPIEKLRVRVEDLNTERGEKLNRVKIIEKEKDDLEAPRNEAIAYLVCENEMAEVTNLLLQKYIKENEKMINEKVADKEEIEKEFKEQKDKLKELGKGKEKYVKAANAAAKKIDELLLNKEKLTEEFKQASNRDSALASDIVQDSKKRAKTKELLAEERKKLISLELIPEKNAKEVTELDTRELKLNADKDKEEETMSKLMASIKTETQELQDKKEVLQTELISLRKTVDETKSVYDIAASKLDLYLSRENQERSKLEQIQKSLDTAKETLVARKRDQQKFSEELPKTEAELKEAQDKLVVLHQEEESLQTKVRNQRAQVESSRSTMQANRSRGRVLAELMKAKADNTLPGIYGRLGDLGAIDKKYDVAISTACGRLDDVVVDSVNTGQKCIEFLRQRNIGSATFIALDKQEHLRRYFETPFRAPANSDRLFDLVTVEDPRVLPAFYFSLRDTLVAPTLELASKIAYGATRYRVVSLKGEIIEMSGTMSGGGRTVLSGRMGQSVVVSNNDSVGNVENMERNLSEMEERRSRVVAEIVSLEQKIGNFSPVVGQLRMNLQKIANEIKATASQVPNLEQQLANQKAKVSATTSDPKVVKDLTASRDEAKEKFDEASAAANKVDDRVKKIHAEIVDKSGGRLKQAKKKLDDIVKMIEKIRQEKTKLTVAIKTSERNTKKCKEKIASMETEVQEAEARILKAKDEKLVIEQEAGQILKDVNEIREEIKKGEEEIAESKQHIGSFSKEENKMKADCLELEQKIEQKDRAIHEYRSKIPELNKRIKNLKLQQIPGQPPNEGLKKLTDEEVEVLDVKQLQYQVTVLEGKLSENKPNLSVIEEYEKKERLFLERVADLESVTMRRNDMRRMYDDARKKRLMEFMAGFTTITTKLKEMYQMITLGGDAEFELVDSLDPFSEGVVFSVRPPQKSWKNISNLSGGEKTLSSLALVFALHYYKPSPLYVMDEIDAALDFKNVSIVGHYIKERTKNAQFIIISLRSNMFELADRLVGIYKTYNCTKSVTINPQSYGIQCREEAVRGQEKVSNHIEDSEAVQ